MEKINLNQKLPLFQDHWKPKIIGELNGQTVKLVKFQALSSGTIMRLKTRCFWYSKGGFGWNFEIARCGSRKESSSLCHGASNIAP